MTSPDTEAHTKCHAGVSDGDVVVNLADGRTAGVDPCIAPLVQALNASGFPTKASCCGHGHRPGNIALTDDRELIIAASYDEARALDTFIGVDIHGRDTEPTDRPGERCRVCLGMYAGQFQRCPKCLRDLEPYKPPSTPVDVEALVYEMWPQVPEHQLPVCVALVGAHTEEAVRVERERALDDVFDLLKDCRIEVQYSRRTPKHGAYCTYQHFVDDLNALRKPTESKSG